MARCPETTADDNRHEHSSTSATTTSRHVATPSTCSTVLVDARALPVNVRPVLVSPRTLIDDEQDMDTNDDMHTIDDMNDHAESRPLLLTPRDDTHDRETHLYPRRWLLLATFCLLTSSSAFLWITFAPRIELFLGFFGVASDRPLAVNAMSLVFMAAFPVFCVPWLGWLTTGSRSAVDSAQRNVDDRVKSGRSESYCSNSHSTDADKSTASTERPSVTPAMDQGLRNAVLSGAIIDAIATLLRWLGCRASSRSYPLVLAGQTLAALGQIPILATPPKLASTWFGVTERNTACALALGANSVGIAVGFVASLALPERYDAVGGTSDGVIEAYMFWQVGKRLV